MSEGISQLINFSAIKRYLNSKTFEEGRDPLPGFFLASNASNVLMEGITQLIDELLQHIFKTYQTKYSAGKTIHIETEAKLECNYKDSIIPFLHKTNLQKFLHKTKYLAPDVNVIIPPTSLECIYIHLNQQIQTQLSLIKLRMPLMSKGPAKFQPRKKTITKEFLTEINFPHILPPSFDTFRAQILDAIT